jgi:hypothetical protein
MMDALTGKRTLSLTVVPEEWPGTEPNPARWSSTSDDAVQTAKQVLASIRKYKPFIVKMIVAGVLLAVAASILMAILHGDDAARGEPSEPGHSRGCRLQRGGA